MDDEDVKVEEEVKKVIVSVNSDAAQTDGIVRINSTGKATTRTSPSPFSGEEKPLPNYLRASTSSCHEFCKYGKKHVFEPKKRLPKPLRVTGSSKTHDEEEETGISAVRGRRKKPELKMKTATQPKDGLLDKPKGNKQNGLEEIQLPAINAVVANKKSLKASENLDLQTPSPSQGCFASIGHSPSTASEESPKGPVSIVETVTPSPAHQIEELSDSSETTKPESFSPTEKRVISQVLTTPLSLSENLSDGSDIMDLESLSPIDTPRNHAEGSFEENLGVEVMTRSVGTESMAYTDEPVTLSPIDTPKNHAKGSSEENLAVEVMTRSVGTESTAYTDEPVTSKPTIPSMQKSKAKISQPTIRSIASKTGSSAREDTSSEKQSLTKNVKIVKGKKREDTNVKTLTQLKTETNRNKAAGSKMTELTGQPTVTKKKSPSLVEKTIVTSDKPNSSEQKRPSSVQKVVMSVSPRVTKQKAPPTLQRIATSAQPSIFSKPRTPVLKSTPTLTSGRRLSTQRNTGNKIMKSAEDPTPKSSRAFVSTKPSAGREMAKLTSMKSRSLKTSSPVKAQAKLGKLEETNEMVKVKTLYVIEPKTRKIGQKPIKKELKKNKTVSSSQTSSSSSSSSSSKSSHEKEENEENESTLSEESEVVLDKEKTKRRMPVQSPTPEKRKPRRTATPQPEARLPSPRKLNFQRGKVVNPEPETNAPRRLKFRKAKGTGEIQIGKERRIFRRRRVSCGSATELIIPKLEAPAVVLRHQDVQEKKDTQVLFNLVIEETANKLVETKKSKVKALVGAFEAVISLQESRVPPTV